MTALELSSEQFKAVAQPRVAQRCSECGGGRVYASAPRWLRAARGGKARQ